MNGMTMRQRSIFRSEALHHYMQGREKTVLPRYVAPPTFAFMWGLLSLLLISGLMLALSYLRQRGGA